LSRGTQLQFSSTWHLLHHFPEDVNNAPYSHDRGTSSWNNIWMVAL